MANTFKNKTFDGSNVSANTDMIPYTAPSSTTTVVIGLTIANITSSVSYTHLTLPTNREV